MKYCFLFISLTLFGCGTNFRYVNPEDVSFIHSTKQHSHTEYVALNFKDSSFEHFKFRIFPDGTREEVHSICGSYRFHSFFEEFPEIYIRNADTTYSRFVVDHFASFSADINVSDIVAPLTGNIVKFKESNLAEVLSSSTPTNQVARCLPN